MYALDGYRLSVRAIPDFEAAKPFQIPEEAMELLSVFADETAPVDWQGVAVRSE